eukprot:CAMPEP_0180141576 /NCGR_PEP_ID=MMETSP0986-20121125/15002_1 /TAXON_ID=697907 /ORGANISM="non described non described, Strain CCMP2293" /LENGTH=425 /DNA_ID=CAMNT_0022084479 /DNA_START=63 /DNA_END=1338 /DNA_ORIENTATION=+
MGPKLVSGGLRWSRQKSVAGAAVCLLGSPWVRLASRSAPAARRTGIHGVLCVCANGRLKRSNEQHIFWDAGDTESPMAHSAATQNGPPGDRSNFRQKNGDGSPMAGTGSDGRRFDERSLPEGLVGHLAGLAGKAVPGRMGSSQQEQRREEQRRTLLTEHGEFLISLVAILEYQSLLAQQEASGPDSVANLIPETVHKPRLEIRQFKSHTMDNVLVKKMCVELLHLEDPLGRPMEEKGTGRGWMKTLQIMTGKHVHSVKINQNPEITIGGYFIIAQMVCYSKYLVSLDLSGNDLTAAAARVLSIGLEKNESIQELRIKDNNICAEGATSMAHMLRKNETLLLLDLRMNNIRGPGVCVLADALAENNTLTDLDLRWNYTGECSDFVEFALLDLKKFCFRNILQALKSLRSREDDAAGKRALRKTSSG